MKTKQLYVLQAMRGNSNQSAKVDPLNIFKDLYRILARQPRWEKARRIQNCQEIYVIQRWSKHVLKWQIDKATQKDDFGQPWRSLLQI